MKEACYAPVYCALYPMLAEKARSHGYALSIHGSMQRDFDLVCVPWTINPSSSKEVIDDLTRNGFLKVIGDPDVSHHGRERWKLSIGFGECFIDLSFMPIQEVSNA